MTMRATKMHWYIAKIAPGASRPAPNLVSEPWHNDEIVAERKIWTSGFDCYYARMKKEIVHHRTNKLVVRSFPLFQTYIFVSLPTPNAEWLKDCNAISYVLGCEGRLFSVDSDVAKIQAAEREMLFDETKEGRIKQGREGKDRRENALRKFRRGDAVRVKVDRTHWAAGFWGEVTGATTRGTIEAVISLFGRLTPVEFTPEELEAA